MLYFNIQFQDRLGSAIRDGRLPQLNSMAEECKRGMAQGDTKEQVTFFKEALKLIGITQFALQGKIHENHPLAASTLNQKVIAFTDAKIDFPNSNKAKRAAEVLKGEISAIGSELKKPFEALEKSLDRWVEDIAKVKNEKRAQRFFVEERIVGDGDCGFHALGITRKETIKHLLSLSHDPAVRAMAAPEIRGRLHMALLAKYDENSHIELSAAIKEKLMRYRSLRTGSDEADALLDEIASEKEVFEAYIAEYYDKGGFLVIPDPETTGILDIIADWKKIDIYIWKKRNDQTLYLHGIAKPSHGASQKSYHLYHRSAHFNRLRPSPDGFAQAPKLGEQRSFLPL